MNDELRADLKELKAEVTALAKQMAVNNVLLDKHTSYSLALQNEQATVKEQQKMLSDRIRPVEEHVKFVSSFLKWAGGIAAVILAQALIRLLLK